MTESETTYCDGLTTQPFIVAPSAHARAALSLSARRWWAVVVLPPLACLVASVYDPMLIIAALIWILQLVPPAIIFIYASVLLRPSVAVMLRPHVVSFGEEYIDVEFPAQEQDEDDTTLSRLQPIRIPKTSITAIQEVSDYVAITYRYEGHRSLLLLPVGCLSRESLIYLANL